MLRVHACTMAVSLLLTFVLFFPKIGACQSVTGREYNVKAGFIYNFINYVSWSDGVFEDESEPVTLCLVSDGEPADVLFKLDGKSVKGRQIRVLQYNKGACVTQSQVLFFATQNIAVIQKVLGLAHGLGILSIGEVDDFIALGGIINFFEESNRLRFEINIDAARREGLKMSSQLLRSAQIVEKEGK